MSSENSDDVKLIAGTKQRNFANLLSLTDDQIDDTTEKKAKSPQKSPEIENEIPPVEIITITSSDTKTDTKTILVDDPTSSFKGRDRNTSNVERNINFSS